MSVPIESIGALQAFVQAAEKHSFRLAGQAVGVTPSAVGKAIGKLEDQLSVRLFHRSTRSVTLTDEGAVFLERCRRILAEVEAAAAEIAQAGAAPTGRLRISFPVEPTLLLPAVCEFSEAYPQIDLDLDITDRFVDVIGEGFDAVIRSGAPKDSRLRHRRLGEFHWVLVASPGYLEGHGMPETVADLAGHRCLRQRFPETGRLMPWPISGAKEEVDLPVSISATSMEAVLELARRGRGIACLPDFAVRNTVHVGELSNLLPGACEEVGSVNLLWPSSRHPLPKVRVFVDFMAVRVGRALADRTASS